MTDETARHGAEQRAEEQGRLAAELREALALVDRQRREIMDLSAPVLEVAPGTLALPVIGALDGRRSAQIEERILDMASARGSRRVILDLTGADVTDAAIAGHVARLGRALRLRGAQPVVTGISPSLATTMVREGVDLEGVLLLRSLREALDGSRARVV
ncbi:MAG: STAS domain-containing protein [Polyangiaceae bacterium]|nr:STAS domain-containing protein [Polyangiaceae bacterium]